jgi:hypothetical protein
MTIAALCSSMGWISTVANASIVQAGMNVAGKMAGCCVHANRRGELVAGNVLEPGRRPNFRNLSTSPAKPRSAPDFPWTARAACLSLTAPYTHPPPALPGSIYDTLTTPENTLEFSQ